MHEAEEHLPRQNQRIARMSQTPVSDEVLQALLSKIAGGDEQSLATLYRMMSRRIYAFSLRRLSNTHLVEEIVVETMYEVWRSASHYDGRSQVSTWVLGIARHKTLDKLRQLQRAKNEVSQDEEQMALIADEAPGAYDRLTQHQQKEQISRCIETLPDEQRECLHLVFYEDMSMREIGEIQNVPDNTVKTRLFHARRKMRECIERQLRQSGAL